MIDPREMKTVAAWRTETYAILSALYSAAPSEAVVAIFHGGGFGRDGRGVFAAARDLDDFFSDYVPGGTMDAESTAEHTRLFVLPSGIVPHESFYLDEKQRLGGHVTINVQKYYRGAGAPVAETCLELPDHIGVELGFMNFLCDLEGQFWDGPLPEGLEKAVDFQKGFLLDHLLRWYEPLCDRILEGTSSDLYRALARFTKEFMEAEREFVPLLAEQVHSQWRTTCAQEA